MTVTIKSTREQRTALYRLFAADGALLYVGVSGYPRLRISQHAGDKPWWPEVATRQVEWYDNRDTAEQAELEAIKAENPRYNTAGRTPPPSPQAALDKPKGRGGRPKFVPNAEQEELLRQFDETVAARDQARLELWEAIAEFLDKGGSPRAIASVIPISASTIYRKLREAALAAEDL